MDDKSLNDKPLGLFNQPFFFVAFAVFVGMGFLR
jgi:hypothetical protein